MPHNYIVRQLRLLDTSHQDVGISKLNTNLANLKTFIKELRTHDMDAAEMETLYKDFQGIQYRLLGQQKAIKLSKQRALQADTPSNAINNLHEHYELLYKQELDNEPEHEGVQFPAVRVAEDESLREQRLQEELENEGVAIAAETQSLVCPITQKRMQHPMVNSQCGHSYDKAAINEHIRRSRALTIRCPVGGCAGFVNQANLKPNNHIADLLEAEDSS